MIKKLLEAKTIDDEYNKDWSDISREVFDKIISLDPTTDIEKNKIGSGAKQILLPKYAEGETDFVDNKEVTTALDTFFKNRGTYPQPLRNLGNFPSVKDFVDYILNGEESEFAKNNNFDVEEQPKEKENKLDKIYKDYYEKDIDRETFDKIIALDPETTENSIGYVAKQFLLPRFIKGENFLSKAKDLAKAVALFEADKDTYPEDKREIQNYETVEGFMQYVLIGPDSDLVTKIKALPFIDEFIIYPGTRKYDIIAPLSHRANNAISCLTEPRRREMEYHKWCTGWTNDQSQWNSHFAREWIYCFMNKQDLKDRRSCYQLAINRDNERAKSEGRTPFTVHQFLDGADEAFGDFNAGSRKSTEFFEQFLAQNPEVAVALTKIENVKENPTLHKVIANIKYLDEPFTYDGTAASLKEYTDLGLAGFIKEIIIQDGVETIPPGAFANSGGLQTVKFPASLKQIGYEAFLACTGLSKLELNNGLKEIQDEAFANCIALKGSVRIPDSLEKIGREAFRQAKCILSINKNRTTKITVDPADKQWYASHTKAITVQEGLQESLYDKLLAYIGKDREDILNQKPEKQNEELELNENIPPDLAKAYQHSNRYNSPNINPWSRHGEIGNKNQRRNVAYDYKNSNYEELTKEQAMEYLGFSGRIKVDNENNPILSDDNKYQIIASVRDRELFNPRIASLRFLTDGGLTEFEVREGNRLVPLYVQEISANKFGQYPLFNGNMSKRTADITRYGDFYTLIQICDKIYKTDEYEHRITSDTPTGKKIKRVNPETGEEEIVDDTIVDRRNRNQKSIVLKRQAPKGSDEYEPHHYIDNMQRRKYTVYTQNELDSGSHDLQTRFARSYTNGYFDRYMYALADKKEAFKRYDYARRALQKHQKERELFDEEEYREIEQDLLSEVKEAKQEYDDACLEVKQAKNNTILFIDDVVKKFNERWFEKVKQLNFKSSKMFNNSNALSNLQLEVSVKDSDRIKRLESDIQTQKRKVERIQSDINSMENQKAELLRQLDQLKQQIENGTTSMQQAQERLQELLNGLATINDDVMKDKFRKIDELRAEQERLQAEIDELAPRAAAERAARAAKNKTKEIDPALSSILDFGQEVPVTNPEGTGDGSTTSV